MDHTKKVERLLCSYKSLVAAVEMDDDLPSIIAKYDSIGGGRSGETSKPTESFALRRIEKMLQVQQMNRALEALTHKERELIERKYFSADFPMDSVVYFDMAMGQTAYYRLKSQVLRKIAIALNFL